MKKLIVLFVLPVMMFAQGGVYSSGVFKTSGGAKILDRDYVRPMNDTTEWINNLQYGDFWFNVQSKDTSRFLLYYQLGNDTSYFGAFTIFDSLVGTSAGTKTKDVTTLVGGFTFFRFLIKNDTVTVARDTIGTTADSTLKNKTYLNGFADTSRWVNASAYSYLELNATSLDSARFVFSYQTASDTTLPSTKTVIDSLVTTSNSGASKAMDATPYIQHGASWIRFIIAAGAGNYGQGTTTNKYNAYYDRTPKSHVIGTYTAGFKRKK